MFMRLFVSETHNKSYDRAIGTHHGPPKSSSAAYWLEWMLSRLGLHEPETKSFHKTAALDGIKKRNSYIQECRNFSVVQT